MKTGSIQIQTKGAQETVSVEIVNDNDQTIGHATLTLSQPNKLIQQRFENVVKYLIKG